MHAQYKKKSGKYIKVDSRGGKNLRHILTHIVNILVYFHLTCLI